MASHGITAEEAKRRAEMRFQKNAQRENEIRAAAESERARSIAETAKIEKLRSLRLAKEAQDRATPAPAPVRKPAAKKVAAAVS
ncbi:hypothetical protein [Ferrovibrio xuzhouensis]|uniref:Uncharacterized protein n=1 Tax=Ferrovibrio xuzhouensis TaxID=1576914 RepID=A0ABV7VED4_9PROT